MFTKMDKELFLCQLYKIYLLGGNVKTIDSA